MRPKTRALAWWVPTALFLLTLALLRAWPVPLPTEVAWAVLPLAAAFGLAGSREGSLRRAAPAALMIAAGVVMIARHEAGAAGIFALGLTGMLLLAAVLAGYGGNRVPPLGLSGGLLLAAAVALVFAPTGPATGPAVAPAEVVPHRPVLFVPLDLDPTGRRLALLSLHDLDSDDDEALSLWSLDLATGQPSRIFQGFPFLLADWAPNGQSLAFMASRQPWLEDPEAPFGIFRGAASGDGRAQALFPIPEDGTSWLYPQWSKVGERVAAWRLSGGAAESWVRATDGSTPAQKIEVPGCRMALAGAWQADAPGLFATTERGLFLVPAEGRPRRLVPAGEAPLEPFPLVVPDGVSPSGRHLAFLQLVFKRGEIDRIDVGLKRLGGRQQSVMRGIHPLAMAWSPDGKTLATGTVVGKNEVSLQLMDAATGQKRAWRTGLTLASRDYPVRFKFSPSGRYLAIDGQLDSADGWDTAVVDLDKRTAAVLPAASDHLLAGWTPQERLLLSSLNTVATLAPDGTGYRPIYGQAAGDNAIRHRLMMDVIRQQAWDQMQQLVAVMEQVDRVR